MIELGVNIDHVATVRQARLGKEPDPVQAALAAEKGGAHWITAHLREDRRHIQDQDIRLIREQISVKFNLEMANTEEMVCIALEIRPHQVTFVPEKRQELTTEGGLDVRRNKTVLKKATDQLRNAGIDVSFFVNPEEGQIKASQEAGAKMVELHTGDYANLYDTREQGPQLMRLITAGEIAVREGLIVNAGHGLNYMNVKEILMIPRLEQLHIGHSIVARAVFVGMKNAVKEMMELIQ